MSKLNIFVKSANNKKWVLLVSVVVVFVLASALYANNLSGKYHTLNQENQELNYKIEQLEKEKSEKDNELKQKDNEINELKQKLTFLPENLLTLTNKKRIEAGVKPLRLNERLNQSATLKAEDMYTRSYWAHDSPDGTEPWVFFDKVNYSYFKAGENLAFGFTTGDVLINNWMSSPKHKENMLDANYDEVGFHTIHIDGLHPKFYRGLTVAHYGSR